MRGLLNDGKESLSSPTTTMDCEDIRRTKGAWTSLLLLHASFKLVSPGSDAIVIRSRQPGDAFKVRSPCFCPQISAWSCVVSGDISTSFLLASFLFSSPNLTDHYCCRIIATSLDYIYKSIQSSPSPPSRNGQ